MILDKKKMWMSTYRRLVMTTTEEHKDTVTCLHFLIMNKFGFKKCSVQYCGCSFPHHLTFLRRVKWVKLHRTWQVPWNWQTSTMLVTQTWRVSRGMDFQNGEQLLLGVWQNQVLPSCSSVEFLENSVLWIYFACMQS